MKVLEITVYPLNTPAPPTSYYPKISETKGDSIAGFSMVQSPSYSGKESFSKSETTTD